MLSRLLTALAAAAIALTPATALAAPPATRTFAGEAHLLVDRDEAWNSIVDIVENAKRSIAVDYYMLGGPRAEELADLLARRQQEGIAVRVVLDPDMGTLPALKSLTAPVLAKLRAAKVPVRMYPREVLAKLRNYRWVEDHTKIVVADGGRAFLGSMNFGAELLHNHDVGVRLEGQVAHAIMDDVLTAFALARPMGPEHDRPWPSTELPKHASTSEIAYVPTGLSGTPARAALLHAIAGAKASISVMMFEFEDEAAADALVSAAQRGVDVRVLVDPNDLDHLSPIGWCPRGVFNLAMASRLALGGVPVRWYRPDPQHRQLHAKSALIDDKLFAGSTNWNHFSFDLNNETMVAITGGTAPGRFADLFEQDWQTRTEPLDGIAGAPRLFLYKALAYMLD